MKKLPKIDSFLVVMVSILFFVFIVRLWLVYGR